MSQFLSINTMTHPWHETAGLDACCYPAFIPLRSASGPGAVFADPFQGRQDPNVRALITRRRTFGLTLFGPTTAVYVGFFLLVAYAPGFLAVGNTLFGSVGYLLVFYDRFGPDVALPMADGRVLKFAFGVVATKAIMVIGTGFNAAFLLGLAFLVAATPTSAPRNATRIFPQTTLDTVALLGIPGRFECGRGLILCQILQLKTPF